MDDTSQGDSSSSSLSPPLLLDDNNDNNEEESHNNSNTNNDDNNIIQSQDIITIQNGDNVLDKMKRHIDAIVALSTANLNHNDEQHINQPSTSTGTTVRSSSKRIKGRNYRQHIYSLQTLLDSDDDEDVEMDSDDSPGNAASSRDGIGDSQLIVDDGIVEADIDATMRTQNPSGVVDASVMTNNSDSESDRSDSVDSNMDTEYSDALSDMDSASEIEPPFVLLKRKPPHKWSIIRELNQRQLGFGANISKQGKGDVLFEQRFYGSLHSVERLELIYKLKAHTGCVNCINFHPEGRLLVSGSDDLNVVIWDWAIKTPIRTVKTGHKSNVLQCKFMHLNDTSQLNIVTCARDGQVRLLQIPPSGGTPIKRKLTQHSEPAHKLYITPAEPQIVISAAEDGLVVLSDLREDTSTKLFHVKSGHDSIKLYSVAGHPLDVNELCVAGHNRYVRVYDRRKAGRHARPIRTYCPEFFIKPSSHTKYTRFKHLSLYITHAVYNHNGSEILASYNDDDIYLFDTKLDADAAPAQPGYTYRYAGHRNSDTFKGVSYFGPRSEFVVSGSDCGNIYMWDKKSEAIVQWMAGDETGTVNCIECHPRCPVMATSGLDPDVKVWVPSNEKEPEMDGLRDTVLENNRAQIRTPLYDEYSLIPNLLTIFNGVTYNRDSDDENSDDNDSGGSAPDVQCRQS